MKIADSFHKGHKGFPRPEISLVTRLTGDGASAENIFKGVIFTVWE